MPSLDQVTVVLQTVVPNVSTDGSLVNSQEGVSLVNDSDSPGANKVYGTNASGVKGWQNVDTKIIQLAASDETTALTAGAGKITFRMPHAMTLSAVRASLTTAQATGLILTIDINKNGVSILSTKLTIDNTEKTSVTAATAAVISDTALPDDAEITVDIDQAGDGTGKGLKIALYGS